MYDIRVHVPERLEVVFKAVDESDIDLFFNGIEDLKNLINDQGFTDDIQEYDNQRKQRIEQAKQNCIESIRKALEAKKIDDIFLSIAEAETLLEAELNDAHIDFMDTIKTYIISYIQNIE